MVSLTEIRIGVDEQRAKFLKRISRSKIGHELEMLNPIFDGTSETVDWNDVVYYLDFLLENEDEERWHGSRYMSLTDSQYRYLKKTVGEAHRL